jgi:hypothetical protein
MKVRPIEISSKPESIEASKESVNAFENVQRRLYVTHSYTGRTKHPSDESSVDCLPGKAAESNWEQSSRGLRQSTTELGSAMSRSQ